MARLLIQSLNRLQHEVDLPSHFRSYDREGDAERQQRIRSIGKQIAAKLIKRYLALPRSNRPDAWVTYHAYHKSPDWLGPAVSAALDIPYLLIETSFAPKQADGPWDLGHRATQEVVRKADVVLALTEVDHAGLAPLIEAPTTLKRFPPFLDHLPFVDARPRREQNRRMIAERFNLDTSIPWLLSVGMMRDDVKYQSYQLLAWSLESLLDRSWQILLVGGGPALPSVEKCFLSLGSERVRMAGILGEEELVACYTAADVYAWPAIREAYGLAILEAQASGLPVVAGREGGVADVVRDAATGLLTPSRDPVAFAEALADLLDHPTKRQSMGRAAVSFVEGEHSVAEASARLDQALVEAGENFKARRYPGRLLVQ